jgi:16S rRNA (uracil1498-N3)-methyltransferase
MRSTGAEQPGAIRAGGAPARPPVFLAPAGDLAGEVIVLSGPEGRHASTVRRLTPGERVDVTDGAGTLAECVVTRSGRDSLELAVRSRRVEPPPALAIVVAQAIPKGERGQLAVEMLTEAGADVVLAWQAERCVTRWQGERGQRGVDRWRATARESAKQARRARIPRVSGPEHTTAIARRAEAASLAILLDPDAPVPLTALPLPQAGEVLVAVGPEGGISPAEVRSLSAAGAVPAHLGPTVLRTSTAGVVATAILLSRCGRW